MSDTKHGDDENTIFGGPTKRFFVSMLTKDIELSDAILDLVDNCVDGAMRSQKLEVGAESNFDGFSASLTINENQFLLKDNCGGIPQEHISDAFHLGRPKVEKDGHLPTIGMFGIGMKRAIFKIARSASVISISNDGKNEVTYSEEWLNPNNDDWNLPIEKTESGENADFGVEIKVDALKPDISHRFGQSSYLESLKEDLSRHFGYIMQKGFVINVNGEPLDAITLPLRAEDYDGRKEKALLPFDFEFEKDAVKIRVTVGLFRPLVHEQEIDEEAIQPSERRDIAGISVICNDRVVVLQDKSRITGWGEGGTPRYHPQFRAIAGLISIYSADAEKLPLSTTKRGLDATSEYYLIAREQSIAGIKIFTDFTNKWKGNERGANEFFQSAKKKDAKTGIALAQNYGKVVRGMEGAKRFKPDLPTPQKTSRTSRISFTKSKDDIEAVSLKLFGDTDAKPSAVGEEAFDRILKETSDE